MDMALRRRLDGVEGIRISQERQTADVSFGPGPHVFSASEFRAAVGEADVEVVRLEVDVCGRVDFDGTETWLTAGPTRFRLYASLAAPPGDACLTAELDDSTDPASLERVRGVAAGRDGGARPD